MFRRLLSPRFSFLYAPDSPPGGGGGDPPPNPPARTAAEFQKDLDDAIATRDAVKKDSAKLRDKYDALNAKVAALEKADAEAKAKAEQDEKLKAGKYEELLADNKKTYEQKLAEQRTKFNTLYNERVVTAQLKQAAASIKGIVPKAVDEVALLLAGRIKVDPETFAITVVDEHGNPALDKEMKPMTIAALAEAYVADRPHYLLSPASPSPGSHPGAGGPGGFGDIKRAMNDPEYMAGWKKADEKGFSAAFEAFIARAAVGGINVGETAKA